jgi:1,5-anhydro-D-fructose reductase (1,5-anhydro-D-mannitol-forming)
MVNFGIVGFGLHAVKRLMPGFAQSKNCRVTALSRRDIRKAEASAAEHKIAHAFSSVDDLCRSKDVDAVFVTSPNAVHLPDVLTALKCGKPVLCEKPLAMDAPECRQMVETAKKANLLFGVAHVFRFNDSVTHIRNRIASGDIGKPVFARCEFSFLATNEHPRKWLYDRSIAGGGPIFDIGVHCIDTLRYVLQDEVVRVSASSVADSRSGDVEAAAAIQLEFSRGALASAFVSYRADYRTPLEIVGNSAVLSAEDALNVEVPVEIKLHRDESLLDSEKVSNHLAYAKQVDEFAAAMEGKIKFRALGEEGWQNQEIIDAAYRSITNGRTEAVRRVV